jgi:hypothetical protein
VDYEEFQAIFSVLPKVSVSDQASVFPSLSTRALVSSAPATKRLTVPKSVVLEIGQKPAIYKLGRRKPTSPFSDRVRIPFLGVEIKCMDEQTGAKSKVGLLKVLDAYIKELENTKNSVNRVIVFNDKDTVDFVQRQKLAEQVAFQKYIAAKYEFLSLLSR